MALRTRSEPSLNEQPEVSILPEISKDLSDDFQKPLGTRVRVLKNDPRVDDLAKTVSHFQEVLEALTISMEKAEMRHQEQINDLRRTLASSIVSKQEPLLTIPERMLQVVKHSDARGAVPVHLIKDRFEDIDPLITTTEVCEFLAEHGFEMVTTIDGEEVCEEEWGVRGLTLVD